MVTEIIGFLPNPLGNLDKLKRILDEKNIEYTIHSDCDGEEVWVDTNDYYCKFLKKHKIIQKKDILNINEQNVSIIIFY
jgi:hypothetical protein